MKNKLYFPLVLFLIILLSACTETGSTTTEISPTTAAPVPPTVSPLPPTMTPEPTATATEEAEDTATPEPTATATPELILPTPEVSLSERIASLDNLPQSTKDVLLPNMENQFPIVEEYDAWRLTCIGGDFVTHEPTIKLPTGKEISHTFACQYQDAEGQDQEMHFPVYTYDLAEDTRLIVGTKADDVTGVVDDPENYILGTVKGFNEKWRGTFGLFDRIGWSGPGHVFIVRFAYPEADSENYLAPDIEQLVTPEQLAEFAQTGDPSLLTIEANGREIALLLADGDAGVSFDNTWGAEQKAITGSLLDD